jgi:hypothetical protein
VTTHCHCRFCCNSPYVTPLHQPLHVTPKFIILTRHLNDGQRHSMDVFLLWFVSALYLSHKLLLDIEFRQLTGLASYSLSQRFARTLCLSTVKPNKEAKRERENKTMRHLLLTVWSERRRQLGEIAQAAGWRATTT